MCQIANVMYENVHTRVRLIVFCLIILLLLFVEGESYGGHYVPACKSLAS